MDNKEKEFEVTAKYNDEDIALKDIEVTMSYDGEEAKVDAETAVKRCILLAHENQFLKSALEKALGQMTAKPKIEIAQAGDIPEIPDGR